MKKLKAVVIGTGNIGKMHALGYSQNPFVDLVAVVDQRHDVGKAVADLYGIQWYPDVKECLRQQAFDIATVATPESSHLELGKALAEAGKAVLMEKPVTPTIEEAKELSRAVDEYGTFMTVNYILRYDLRVMQLKEKLAAGELGDPVTYFARRRGSFAGAQFYGRWTDLLISTAIHDLDLMLYLNPSKPIRVYAESVRKKCAEIGVDDAYMATLKFEDGSVGSLETSWVMPSRIPAPLDASFQFIGTEGAYFIDGSNQGVQQIMEAGFTHPDLTHWPVISGRLDGNLKASIDHFVASVLNGEEPFVPVSESIKSLQLVKAIQQSIKEGAPVYLNGNN